MARILLGVLLFATGCSTGKLSSCEKMGPQDVGMDNSISEDVIFESKPLCYYHVAMEAGRINLCAQIQDSWLNRTCIEHFAVAQGDSKLCFQVRKPKDEPKEMNETNRCLEHYAYLKLDPGACQMLSEQPGIDSCLQMVEIYKKKDRGQWPASDSR